VMAGFSGLGQMLSGDVKGGLSTSALAAASLAIPGRMPKFGKASVTPMRFSREELDDLAKKISGEVKDGAVVIDAPRLGDADFPSIDGVSVIRKNVDDVSEFGDVTISEAKAPTVSGGSETLAKLYSYGAEIDGAPVYDSFIAGPWQRGSVPYITDAQMRRAVMTVLDDLPIGAYIGPDNLSGSSLPMMLNQYQSGRLSSKNTGQVAPLNDMGVPYKNSDEVAQWHNAKVAEEAGLTPEQVGYYVDAVKTKEANYISLRTLNTQRRKLVAESESLDKAKRGKIEAKIKTLDDKIQTLEMSSDEAAAALDAYRPQGRIMGSGDGFDFDNRFTPGNQMGEEVFYQIDPAAKRAIKSGNAPEARKLYENYQLQSDNGMGVSGLATEASTAMLTQKEAEQLAEAFNKKMGDVEIERAANIARRKARGKTDPIAPSEGIPKAVVKRAGYEDEGFHWIVEYPTIPFKRNFKHGGKFKIKKKRPAMRLLK